MNPLYAKIKPVKLDSASSKPSKESVDLAQGPQEERKPPPPTKSWSFNPFSSSSKKTESPPQPTKVPDGVSVGIVYRTTIYTHYCKYNCMLLLICVYRF